MTTLHCRVGPNIEESLLEFIGEGVSSSDSTEILVRAVDKESNLLCNLSCK
jgi:hypothetical protein